MQSGRQRVRVWRWVGPVARWARCERVETVGRVASCSIVFVVRAWNVVAVEGAEELTEGVRAVAMAVVARVAG